MKLEDRIAIVIEDFKGTRKVDGLEPKKNTDWAIPTIAGLLSGGFFGIPLSYYFQNAMVRAKVDIWEYTDSVFTESFADAGLMGPVIAGIIVWGALGGAFGFFSARVTFPSEATSDAEYSSSP